MARDEIHEGDIGTVFELTVKDGSTAVDVSASTSKVIKFMDPYGVVTSHSAAFVTDGTDGKIKYTTIAGDLTPSGLWRLQAVVGFSNGTWNSDIKEFQVFPNLS